jgi:hypothetical protein
VPLVEQELITLPEHLSSHPVLSGVRVQVTEKLYYMVNVVESRYRTRVKLENNSEGGEQQ